MPASPLCRENADRAIFINETIDQRLVNSLTPQILKLRKQGTEPITVYIDSGGGYPRLADTLGAVLSAPNPEGKFCATVTVVTGWAASAAADFLAHGGYVIAYPGAIIHFHGTRQADKKEDLTMEKASTAAKFLREYNDIRAIELAQSCIKRSIFIYLNLRDSFSKMRETTKEPDMPDIQCFAQALYEKLSPAADQLPLRALDRYGQMQELSNYVLQKLKVDITKPDKPAVEIQRTILRSVIEYEYRASKKDPTWTFTDENLDRIIEDFRLIQDFYTGEHYEFMIPIVRAFGSYFLNKEDAEEFKSKQFADDKERQEWLFPKAVNEFQPLWYFVVSICRLLQEKENALTAFDAYWLGIVHEVLGSRLPCIRQILENPPTSEAKPAPKPTGTATPPAANA
jgi:ATP-dependent protease ClpP protease subunit